MIQIDEAVVRQALEALLSTYPPSADQYTRERDAITALRHALEQPAQQDSDCGYESCDCRSYCKKKFETKQPAQQKPGQKMTHQQAAQLINEMAAQQEPVAWMHEWNGVVQVNRTVPEAYGDQWTHTPLYTRPPAREWVGLTDEEQEIASWTDGSFGAGARWAEAKLRGKNA